MTTSIVFFYPSRTIGGAQLLFVRMANELSKLENLNVIVIDYIDGFLRANVSESVVVLDWVEGSDYKIEGSVYVISPLSMVMDTDAIIKIDQNKGRYLYWCIHPENTIDILRGSFRLRKYFTNIDTLLKLINFNKYCKVRSKLRAELLNNAILFMDGENKRRTLEFYGLQYDKNMFVPVPVASDIKKIDLSSFKKGKVIWVGRLSEDKIHSLLYVLKMLNEITLPMCEVHVVGDGPCRDLIDKRSYPHVNITLHGFVDNNSLPKLILMNEIGLAVGMGTSILETSAMGLPSLLIDPSYTALPDNYQPKWTFEIRDYILGGFIHTSNGRSFSDYYFEYCADKDSIIAGQCLDYVNENHSLEKVTRRLEAYFV